MPSQDWGKHGKRLMLPVSWGGDHSPGVADQGLIAVARCRHCLLQAQGSFASPPESTGMRRWLTARSNTSARRFLSWAGIPLPRLSPGQGFRG